jgi:hypothetical protein
MMNNVTKAGLGVALAFGLLGSYFTFTNYSDGERAGQVVKFSKHGWFPGCKMWEGEMVLGGLRGMQSTPDGTGANIFTFTVSDSAVIDKIQHKLKSGEHVLIRYAQPYWNFPCTTDTGYFITEVVD